MQGRRGAVDVVGALVATINDHDPVASRELFRSDAWVVTAAGRRLDLDGLERMLEVTLSAFPDLTMRVARWLVDGNVVVTEEVMEATHCGDVDQAARVPAHQGGALEQRAGARPTLRHPDDLAMPHRHLSRSDTGEAHPRRPRGRDRRAPVHVGPGHTQSGDGVGPRLAQPPE